MDMIHDQRKLKKNSFLYCYNNICCWYTVELPHIEAISM